jgi:LAS superfamily LD-carboxypeptidase LdcB
VNLDELTGRTRRHIVESPEAACALHAHVVTPFVQLQRAGRSAGLEIEAVSTFRDFDRQLAIWNGKFSGERPMLDAAGRSVDAGTLSAQEKVRTILLWSALPGASRHHWGTDVDLIDRSAVSGGYRPQLTEQEFAPGGPFERLAAWLRDNAARFGFFRPFRGLRSGVRPEAWHFSFAPVAESARRLLTPQALRSVLDTAPLLGKDVVLQELDALHERYVQRIDLP